MHICPDELGPLIAIWEFIPQAARILWYKVTWWRR